MDVLVVVILVWTGVVLTAVQIVIAGICNVSVLALLLLLVSLSVNLVTWVGVMPVRFSTDVPHAYVYLGRKYVLASIAYVWAICSR